MPNPQNRNDRRKGEDRSETLIIPHITKEMLETARRMAEEGASRAEIEKAISAMQSPAQPASSPAPPGPTAAPAPQPMAPRRSVNTVSSPPAAPVFRPKNAPPCASRCRWGRHRQKRPSPNPNRRPCGRKPPGARPTALPGLADARRRKTTRRRQPAAPPRPWPLPRAPRRPRPLQKWTSLPVPALLPSQNSVLYPARRNRPPKPPA